MNRIRRLLPPRAALPSLLALALLVAACGTSPLQRPAAGLVGAQPQLCFSAAVATGSHEIPAFNHASLRAMTRLAGTREVTAAERCGDGDLRLDYRMTFDARSLSWNASLAAVDGRGRVLWRGDEAATIPPDGAFQYLTESNAERLLQRFLDRDAR